VAPGTSEDDVDRVGPADSGHGGERLAQPCERSGLLDDQRVIKVEDHRL